MLEEKDMTNLLPDATSLSRANRDAPFWILIDVAIYDATETRVVSGELLVR